MPWPVERNLLILIVVAYFIGSIPFGLLVGWTRGIDVRRAGSGNIGASNVGRLLGKRYFWGVMSFDLIKSLLPMLAAKYVTAGTTPCPLMFGLWLGVGFAALLGHMFSIYLKFKGGKGVASSAGIMLGLYPYLTLPGAVTIATFVIFYLATRYISVGSIAAAIMFPVSYLGFTFASGARLSEQWPLLAFSVVISALVIIKHRGNIARLRAGTENRMGAGSGNTADKSHQAEAVGTVLNSDNSTNSAAPAGESANPLAAQGTDIN
jgi:glycerol-3-phosphate acyltransferase PlsY